MPSLKKTMFREYDLRGREAEDELNETSMYFIGRGFGTFLKQAGVAETVVGHDARASSEKFQAQFIRGLLECGINVVDIGTATTPMGYWAQNYFNVKGGAVVTASHNPMGWNGVKISDGFSKTLSGNEIQKVYRIIASDDFVNGHGSVRKESVINHYINDLVSKTKLCKKFKVLVNTGNGTAAIVAPEILRKLDCEVVELNTNINPTYPNYVPNPDNPAMMEDTSRKTMENHCDLGFAVDGDSDRLGMVDEKGNIIPADIILLLLSRLLLNKHPGSKIMFDVKATEALPEDIKARGGIPIMYKTGHSLIKAEMHRQGISLTGEMSGHIFLGKDFGYYGFDDAMFAALKILEYLSAQDKKLSEIIAQIPRYISTPLISIEVPDETKHHIVKQLVKEFKKDGLKMVDIDGARVYVDDGWGLVRASNTTPTLVVRFEAKTKEGLEKIKKIFEEKFKPFGIKIQGSKTFI